MQDSFDLDHNLLNQVPDAMDGEPLDGSGFEPEEPDPGFLISEQEAEE